MTLEAGDRQTSGRSLGHEFPDYRRLVRLPAGRRAHVDTAAFRQTLETGPVRTSGTREPNGGPYDLSVLRVAGTEPWSCATTVTTPRTTWPSTASSCCTPSPPRPGRAGPRAGRAHAPLAIRRPDDEDTFSLLMPVRLDD